MNLNIMTHIFYVTTDENNLDQNRKCYALTYSESGIEFDIRYSFDGVDYSPVSTTCTVFWSQFHGR